MKALKYSCWSLLGVVLTLEATAASPFTPPIENRLEKAEAVVEGHFVDTSDPKQRYGLYRFQITKEWRTHLKLADSILLRDDSQADDIFGFEVYVGKRPFEFKKPLTLILYERRTNLGTEFFKLTGPMIIDDKELKVAKKLWRKKRFTKTK